MQQLGGQKYVYFHNPFVAMEEQWIYFDEEQLVNQINLIDIFLCLFWRQGVGVH